MRSNSRVRLLIAALLGLCCVSCDSRHSFAPAPRPAAGPAQTAQAAPSSAPAITVASLAPAATDLIIGMGAGDDLVAVSNFDFDRPNLPHLPRVGDYQNTDWERLSELRPSLIIVQMQPGRVPAGFRDRAAAIGAKLIDIQIERLADIDAALDELGNALHEQTQATAAKARLHARLDAVRQRVATEPPVTTLLALDDRGASAAGPGTFLDEILTIAGGRNVLAGTSVHWPSIDQEQLIALSPAAVVQLLPGASPQVLAQAAAFWATLPTVPAVANHRVFQITEPWALVPGLEVADLAEQLAAILHPAGPTTTPNRTEPTP